MFLDLDWVLSTKENLPSLTFSFEGEKLCTVGAVDAETAKLTEVFSNRLDLDILEMVIAIAKQKLCVGCAPQTD